MGRQDHPVAEPAQCRIHRQRLFLEGIDGGTAKLRELSLSYHLGRISGTGDWTVAVIGQNLLTLTGYRGFDPEVGLAGATNQNISGSRANNAVDAFVFPNLRKFTVRLATSF